MAVAWSNDWFAQQVSSTQNDAVFQKECAGFDRTVTIHVLADPDNGVADEHWHGFNPPYMTHTWWGSDSRPESTDYVIEGGYEDWRKVNEGEQGLVDSLLDGSIVLTGNTSYLAQFVPAIERFYAISRGLTDTYDGNFKVER
jgi:hypothetical protein